ncbi:MAG: LPS export ABC transporter periplasmic protein LptC [Betaproteobacteria bacterium]|nr:LPS export ABC transporter periplasmic protein LptC [Betaproteobacteria bacterium]
MKRGFSFFPLVLAGLLAGLTFWLEHFVSSQAPQPSARLRHDPDMIAENAIQERFDHTGKLQYVLKARRTLHFPDDDSTHVETAQLDHFGQPEVLSIASDTGIVSSAGKEVVLAGNVQGHRAAGPRVPEYTFSTTQITIIPDEERAYTDQPVHMTRGRSFLDGIGLQIDQINGVAVIGTVRATIYPQSRANPS